MPKRGKKHRKKGAKQGKFDMVREEAKRSIKFSLMEEI